MALHWKSKYENDMEFGSSQSPNIPKAIVRLLRGRGFKDFLEAKDFLYPQLKDLQDPYTILGMKVAIERMIQAFINSETANCKQAKKAHHLYK